MLQMPNGKGIDWERLKHDTTYSSHCAEAFSSLALTRNTRTNEPKLPVWQLLMEKFLQIREVASSNSRWSALGNKLIVSVTADSCYCDTTVIRETSAHSHY